MKDPLKKFIRLREALTKRRGEIEAELAKVSEALGTLAPIGIPLPPTAPRASKPESHTARRSGKLSLAEAVLTVTKTKPLPKAEILEAVTKLGYTFKTKDPLNSLGATLYTNRKIKNFGRGVFGPKWLIRPSSPTGA